MSRLVYACRLIVPQLSTLDPIVKRYGDWIERHYHNRFGKQDFSFDASRVGEVTLDHPPNHHLAVRQWQSGADIVHDLSWRYPSDTDGSLFWRNEIKLLSEPTGVRVEHLILIEAVDFIISPAQVALGSPGVIRRICSSWSVRVGDMHLRAQPYPFQENGVAELVSLLESPERRIPVVFVAPYANESDSLLDPDSLAHNLAGVAVVVDASDTRATWAMAHELGHTLSCYNGAARIYWPGFHQNDNPRRHPLYLAERIEALGATRIERAIEGTIFSVASFRYSPDPLIADIVRKAQLSERRDRIEFQRAEGTLDWEAYALELDVELLSARQQLAELKSENANLRENQALLFSLRQDGSVEPEAEQTEYPEPKNVYEAVKLCQSKCQHLLVLDSAFESAADSPFRRPSDIVEALMDLETIATRWSQDAKERWGGNLIGELKQKGWGKRASMHLSQTTKTQFAQEYTFKYKGEAVMFEPHLTLGSGDANSCASIHFRPDEEGKRIVIAHVGRHLSNTRK